MNDQENRSIVLPHITKEADTVYLGTGDQKKTDFDEVTNVFYFDVADAKEPEEQAKGPDEQAAQESDEQALALEDNNEPKLYRELDFYFEHLNDGRPFFVACDQNSTDFMKEKMVGDYMATRPEFFDHMIATYADGYNATKNALAVSGKSTDLGVVVAAAPADMTEDINTRLAAWQDRKKIRIPEEIKLLPLLIVKPLSCGPEFIKKKSAGASWLAIVMRAFTAAFFAISMFNSLNVVLLDIITAIVNKMSKGASGLNDELKRQIDDMVIDRISALPGFGRGLGATVDRAADVGVDYVTRYVYLEISNFLVRSYAVMRFPVKLGFALGFVGSLLASMLMILLIKALLKTTAHPLRRKGAGLSIVAIRSMIAIPFICLSGLAALFSPALGLLVYGLVFIFETVYIFGLLMRSASTRSADRLCMIYPFFVILSYLISMAAIAIVIAGEGVTAYMKAYDVLFNTMVRSMR